MYIMKITHSLADLLEVVILLLSCLLLTSPQGIKHVSVLYFYDLMLLWFYNEEMHIGILLYIRIV